MTQKAENRRYLSQHERELAFTALAALNLDRDLPQSDRTSRAGNTHYTTIQRVVSRSKHRRGGWARLRGGSGVVALTGCVGHDARYGIPKLGERSARASQVRMRCESKTANCAYGPKTAEPDVGVEQSTSDESKNRYQRDIAIAPIALEVITPKKGRKVQMGYVGATEYYSNSTVCIVASLRYRSGRILIFGWTMMYKWGHPAATLPSDEGDNTSLYSQDERYFCISSASEGLKHIQYNAVKRALFYH
eukprot:4612860-Pleurochrysis_carterae.AAC.5